jgi:hypothetical protein
MAPGKPSAFQDVAQSGSLLLGDIHHVEAQYQWNRQAEQFRYQVQVAPRAAV